MVKDAPVLPQVLPQIAIVLNKYLLAYNLEFNTRVLNYCCKLQRLPMLGLKKSK
ncbi:hypothetical protein H6F93_09740 [Leptolyngbya sp. FACHB-671]|uniref:hypothetical protein n=1 Tax=Leptolyngbya sp. FACHB-671 TaxID=2692812 RepID=UPI001683D49D|nr:hypothetical protein [Leptolyngbya sp. FACHB-671]MBD2067804.1 hypothetical protein [Leptolyngbya sp. FACHB-671]